MRQQRLFDEADPFDGVDGTFAGAKHEPFHSWYAYLEGYAAAFVEGLASRFLPKATRIIDPFAGTGTTPFALSTMGVTCGHCEINPVLRLVIDTKLSALQLSERQGRGLASEVDRLASALPHLLRRVDEDQSLKASYGACFDESRYFDDVAYSTVLRMRSLCDGLEQSDTVLARLLLVSVMSQLVNSSLLRRAGDLRFKTPADLSSQFTSSAVPQLLTFNAKELSQVPPFEADGVITSPPYLNGTNYIRNTKLELWFNRFITSQDDLRRFRDDVVTAGINDVAGRRKPTRPLPDSVRTAVSAIEARSYDDRIPRMVGSYFADMMAVMNDLALHCKREAVLCIDIGDSRYGGVSVPTPDLLVEISSESGFRTVERVPVRSRLSKDKTPLHQEVVVMRYARTSPRRSSTAAGSGWRPKWDHFKRTLPHQKHPFTKRNWGHPLHSACSYLGKMKPALAHFLVECFSEPGQCVLDPFSGAGTIPFEAALAGRGSVGLDISLMAMAVTSAKVRPPKVKKLDELLLELERHLATSSPSKKECEAAAMIRFNGPLADYFHPKTFQEVLSARSFFMDQRDDSPEWCFALTCLLHVLHGNRPYALSRRSHPVTPFAPTGPSEYRSLLAKVRAKVARSLEVGLSAEYVAGKSFQGDLCATWPRAVGRVDSIITSPPFFDSTRFYMSNWMRFWFCGWERQDFDSEPRRYVESLQRESFEVYRPIFENFREHLSDDGVVLMHLGHSRKCDMAQALARVASQAFSVADVFSEDVTHCESHGVRDKGTVTAHQYLVLLPK